MMHASVEALTNVLPPPSMDTEGKYRLQFPPPLPDSGGDRFDWQDLATRTGWRYPADYRSFLETYGAGGSIDNSSLSIGSPPPAGVPYSVDRRATYPPADGLHIWGGTVAGDAIYWRCVDPDPDRWTVAVRLRSPYEGRNCFDYPLGMVDFLTGLLEATLDVPLGVDLQAGTTRHTFEGWRDFDLEVRAAYPDFQGLWPQTLSRIPQRRLDA